MDQIVLQHPSGVIDNYRMNHFNIFWHNSRRFLLFQKQWSRLCLCWFWLVDRSVTIEWTWIKVESFFFEIFILCLIFLHFFLVLLMVICNESIVKSSMGLTGYWFDYTSNRKPTRHVKAPVIRVGFFFFLVVLN